MAKYRQLTKVLTGFYNSNSDDRYGAMSPESNGRYKLKKSMRDTEMDIHDARIRYRVSGTSNIRKNTS